MKLHLVYPTPRGMLASVTSLDAYLLVHVLPRSRRGDLTLLTNVLCSVFDQRCNFLRVRDLDRVAGSGNFDCVAAGPWGIPALEIGG